MPKESGIAKSIGDQQKDDLKESDVLLYNYLTTDLGKLYYTSYYNLFKLVY